VVRCGGLFFLDMNFLVFFGYVSGGFSLVFSFGFFFFVWFFSCLFFFFFFLFFFFFVFS